MFLNLKSVSLEGMDEMQKFIVKYPIRKFDRNQIIFCQGDNSDVVYIIRKGFVKGYDINSQGVEQLVWFGVPGDFCPCTSLFKTNEGLLLFYSSLDKAEMYVVERDALLKFLNKQPAALMEMTKRFASLATDLIRRLAATGKPKADEKIAHTLAFFADRFSESKRSSSRRLVIPLKQQDLANLLGLTRETVAKELKRLKEEKYITYNRWRFVVYRDKIEELL